jgi:hypothetical protein
MEDVPNDPTAVRPFRTRAVVPHPKRAPHQIEQFRSNALLHTPTIATSVLPNFPVDSR